MKTTLLATALVLAMHGAVAADPAPAAPADKATDRAAAREELAELRTQIGDLSRRMAELSIELGDIGPRAYAFRYITDPDRAIIGVVLASEARGVRIEALTPDGPAERAGLRNGDVITAIDGKVLAGGDAEAKLDDARERLAGLKDGQEVRIGYERDGKAGKELRLAAQRRAAKNWPTLIADGDAPSRVVYERQIRDGMKQVEVEMARAHAEAARAGVEAQRAMSEADRARFEAGIARIEALRDIRPGWDINLTSLNPELGRYFGADSGVLVLSAGSDTLAGLKAGDVIRKIEGRAITRPEEALRALRDEPTGSEVELDVLRERKAVALKVKVPEYKSIFRIGRAAPLPPVPPTPPTAPTAPRPADAPAAPGDAVPAPPAPPHPAMAPVAPDDTSVATVSTQARMKTVSLKEARSGGRAGAPALWGGRVVDARLVDDDHCLLIDAQRIDAQGRPIARLEQHGSFLACQGERFDASTFRKGALVTFAGHVAPERPGKTVPIVQVTDARAWDASTLRTVDASRPPQGYDQGQVRALREAAYDRRH